LTSRASLSLGPSHQISLDEASLTFYLRRSREGAFFSLSHVATARGHLHQRAWAVTVTSPSHIFSLTNTDSVALPRLSVAPRPLL
jgi:hypothetical protein